MANPEHLKLLKRGVDIWNKKRPDRVNLAEADLSGVNLRNADLSGTDLSGANLSETNLIFTDLKNANLKNANLSGANLSGSDLSYANLRNADLSYANLMGTDLIEANLSGANLIKTNLSGADLNRANLSGTDLRKADLTGANLTGAKLTGANFQATQALNTNFESTNLTAACIEDLHINIQTNLTNVICDYIYLKDERWEDNGKMIFTERRPSNPDENFAPGDFARLVQKTIETLDLIFRDGIEWKSFALSLQELNQEAKIKIASESENDPLSIRAIETRDDGSFVIRVNIPAGLDKGEIEKSFQQKYEWQLQAKDELIQLYLQNNTTLGQHNTILEKIIDTLLVQANKPNNINYMSNNGDIYNLNGPTGIAHNSGEIKDQVKIAGVLNEAQQENINMIKVEIEQILQPLLEKYPTNTTSEQMIVASQAIQQIENNPSLKARLINAIKEGTLAALAQSLNHPVCSFIINALKGWQEAQ